MLSFTLSGVVLNDNTKLTNVYGANVNLTDIDKEFAMAYANVIGEGNSKIHFGITGVNFNYAYSALIESSIPIPNALYPEDPFNAFNNTYAIYQTNENGDHAIDEKGIEQIASYNPVCIFIDDVNVQYSYYNPTSSKGYNPNNWSKPSLEEVQKAVNDSHA